MRAANSEPEGEEGKVSGATLFLQQKRDERLRTVKEYEKERIKPTAPPKLRARTDETTSKRHTKEKSLGWV